MHLNCHTSLSFKYGTLSAEALFNEAKRCGLRKIALTEINNTASYIEMLRLCEQNRTQPDGKNKAGEEPHDLALAVGVEFRRAHELLFVAIARNNHGLEEINRFLSFHSGAGRTIPTKAPAFDDVFIIYPFQKVEPEHLKENEFIGIRVQDLGQLTLYKPYQQARHRFVVLQPVTFAAKTDYNVHRLLRAIDNNTLLSKLPASLQALPDEIMMTEQELELKFKRYPQIIHNSRRLLEECSIDFTMGEDKNKKNITGSVESDWDHLVGHAWEGFRKRYNASDPVLRERLDRELWTIRLKDFCSYYLIAHDLVQFAKASGYDYVGRGSGANSIVAFCLGITNVDPIELDLYFERFLNEERATPPDFDIDFSWDNRDAIYDYLFERYGREHVCLLGTHVTYQEKSILRELGKVFGLPKHEIDALVDNPEAMQHRDHITTLIYRYAGYMKDLPANLSIHAGGVLITEKPIFAYTATAAPPKGYPVSHFEMHAAEDLGICKFDILSQRGLGHLREAVAQVKRNRGVDVDIHQFARFKTDEKIRELLRNSRTVGCFYVESPAMRMLLGKLRCEDYITLVAASSIIRPGVASSGMMRTYIERFHAVRNGGTYASIHPKMDELMKETYGVMVYQEDVIKVAHYFGGLTLTEADVLRRGMSGKYRSRHQFLKIKDQFFGNCQQRGYGQEVIERVWFEIESFSGYSFAKGHSASYAVESYQSLYLKAHHPLEFMVGVINNFGGFYHTEFYFHEARMSGATITAPCINCSEHLTTIYGDTIVIGFIHLKGLEARTGKQIPAERKQNGPFQTMDDLLSRIPMGLEQVRILIRIGALRFTGKTKQRLLWEAMLWFSQSRTRKPGAELFDTSPVEFPLPALERKPVEDAFDEIELLGFPLCDPFRLLATGDRGNFTSRQLSTRAGEPVSIVGYMVSLKETRTRAGESMCFGTFYDLHGDIFDTVHFPQTTRQFPLRGRGFYFIKGTVMEEFGVTAVRVSCLDKMPLINKRADEFMRENNYNAFNNPPRELSML
jgi:DNA-directed DNA polymerase III PolC